MADLTNTAIYATQGNYKEAALSALSAVPAVGDGIATLNKGTKLVKMGKKLTKAVDLFNDGKKLLIGKFNDLIEHGMKASKKVFEVGGTLTKKLKKPEFLTKIKGKMKNICLFGHCFKEDTLVHTEKGYVRISNIIVGDLVYSMDEETGEIGLKKVKETSNTFVHTIFEIEVNNEEKIKTTKYHPFYVEDKGWINVINLEIGDKLVDDHDVLKITSIKKVRYEEPVIVYNFHVEDWASYFVSKLNIYVHNGEKHIHSNSIDYKEIFFKKYSDQRGKVWVHHGVEQQILTKPQTKGLFTIEEMHSIENLRGIPKEVNSDLHLSKIRKEWNKFYKEISNPTKEQLLQKRLDIDKKYGHLFNPPIVGD